MKIGAAARQSWVLIVLTALAGCANVTEEPPQACTEIGCSDGLAVEVVSSLAQSISVTVKAGAQELHTFRCDPGQPCRAFIDNQTPAEVTIEVQTAQGAVSKTYRPEYQINRPNGPGCPPECKQATVTVTLS